MKHCDFCDNNYRDSFKSRILVSVGGFVLATPRKPYHEFHILIFDSSSHKRRLDLYRDDRIVQLKNLINKLDNLFAKQIKGYQGYNLTSNNGDKAIGQHYEHAHVHLFMRYKGESESPFVRMSTNNPIASDGVEPARIEGMAFDKLST